MAESATWPAVPPPAATSATPHPNSATYDALDREAAFLTWYALPKRTFRDVAAILGVDKETVSRWAKLDGWKERTEALDSGAAAYTDGVSRALVRPLFPIAVLTTREIMVDRSAHASARIRACELAAGWNGLVVPKAPQFAFTQNPDGTSSVTLKLSDLAQLTPEQRRAVREQGISALPLAPVSPTPDTGLEPTE